jgi:AcrR family transcriptional regulator
MKARGRGKYDRTSTRAERRDEQRRRLLEAAARVFAARGYAGATVEAIVERAGMSRRTFYEHFKDLRAALMELHDRAEELAFALVESRVRAADGPLARVQAGVLAFLEMLAENGELARVVFREVRAAGPIYAKRHEAVLERYVHLLREGIAEARRDGLASRVPDEVTLFALVSALEAVGMRFVERHEEAKALEAAPSLVELVVRAFL